MSALKQLDPGIMSPVLQFAQIDRDGSGTITQGELARAGHSALPQADAEEEEYGFLDFFEKMHGRLQGKGALFEEQPRDIAFHANPMMGEGAINGRPSVRN